ncbi:MAG TPA: cation diffusion facilitator family transporter [Syntrophobacter fumaroxidans]|nr:cation diffusion facilitator family transporter [Syntrophobacter fumaroxidans]
MTQKDKTRAATLSVLSNTALTVLKLVVGIMTQSVGVIAEAVHSGLDLLAAVIAWFSVRASEKPADDRHRYGHGQIESVSGVVEALLIFAAAGCIIFEALEKLWSDHVEIETPGLGAAVMAVSAIVNYFVSRHLYDVAEATDSLALKADALHLRTDVFTSVGVFAGLVAIEITGMNILDPLAALLVAVLILKAAYDLVGNAVLNILEVRLPDHEEEIIMAALDENSNRFVEFHKLRTRKSGSTRHIDMHLVVSRMTSVEEGHRLSHLVAGSIRERLPNCEVLVHIEPCGSRCEECRADCPTASVSPWR